ncbi:transcriptional regulator, AraC family [Streptomyces sp. WMMB 714]|uniref:helix-turn-helix transcriptional regulator n=1 Tax=Streptomyces sp. WMMB 714 TaxID=1286822 RepID=UPI0005F87DEB|nr:helix-turn-helix transcriptional regulator [Streptomyces sp. WMMB 714]SCK18764.1 transcriptional regulator, AraC family [Streptomyces sp. WMMB 714]
MYEEWRSQLPGAVVWTYRGAPDGEGRVLPDGCMDLLWWDGALVVAGPDTRAHVHSPRSLSRITGLRFAPGTGPAVFGLPAYELRDQRVPLDALWPERAVRSLEERVAAASAPGRALELVSRDRLRQSSTAGPLPPAVVELLARGRGVADVARTAGLSERQLHRRCRDAFGYGPKTLARVLRLQRALGMADSAMPLGEVAAASGYADQAHLSREFRALAGMPPARLLSLRDR